jgi:hypothetical protein
VGSFLLACYVTECRAVKFLRKHFLGKDVEAVLQRLNRLTEDEARTAAAQTLEVVHGLFQDMRLVMDGEQTHSFVNNRVLNPLPSIGRRNSIR